MTTEPPRHTVLALLRDRPGVLNRVTSMIRRRTFNITSLAVGHSEHPGLSRMTFVVEGDELVLEQITKQLRKLIDVVEVSSMDRTDAISRELAMIRVQCTPESRGEIVQIGSIFRANIVDVAHDSMIIEVTGDDEKIESLIQLLRPFGIGEIMRSGKLAMSRGLADAPEPELLPAKRAPSRRRTRVRDELGW